MSLVPRGGDGHVMRWRVAVLGLAILLLSACATPPQTAALHAQPPTRPKIELTGVPFFPQEAYQCGPAALATVLGWSGASITPDALTPQVYVPARRGSLQVELLGAARRQGRIPYTIEPRLPALLDELYAGHPVLVLLNLGLSWYPVWHYAVVVGYDPATDRIIMRSGRVRRDAVRLAVFERTWARSNYWGLLVLPPDQLPATVEELPYLQAVAELERLQLWKPAETGYETAAKRWPTSLGAYLGLGNARYAQGDLPGAAAAFRTAVAAHPEAAPAYNNLAQVLAEQGHYSAAEQAIKKAIAIGGPLQETYRETYQEIRKRRAHNR